MRSALVVAGGVVGTLARWGVDTAFLPSPSGFPWATPVVNVTGAFTLDAVGVALIERVAHAGHLRTLQLIEDRAWRYAAWNLILSGPLSFGAAALGYLLAS